MHHCKVLSKLAKWFWRYHNYSIFNMVTIHHLGSSNFRFVVDVQANMHHRTKFHQNQSNGCRDVTFNGFQNGGHLLTWIFKTLNF